MKIAITGGHFSPAYAFIEQFRDEYEFVIIGRKHTFEGDSSESFEYRVSQQEKIPFYALQTARIQRKLTARTFPSLFKFPKGVVSSIRILQRTKPDIVLSFGGYLSVPVAIAAKTLGIPIVIHEQTQAAGLANKFVGTFANKILLSFTSSARYFSKNKTVVTGNPLRTDIFNIKKKLDVETDLPMLYITGGSSGSHFLNQIMSNIMPQLLQNYAVIHQTGDSQEFQDFDALTKFHETLPEEYKNRYIVSKFIFPDQIGWIMQNAALLISRSGINTVHEIIALKKTALLIPLPYGQNNEQLHNAKLIKKIGLGEYLEQSECTPALLLNRVHEMISHIDHYKVGSISDEYYRPDATKNIEHELQLVYAQKNKEK